ncbi:unnamed protein product [Caenorhabditis bovis]|uniref:Uncharacterized protein n=1 Tax=Caenorhabditis bovis TaxID=2654633 RepID=A0A8S1F3D6_9PELO|nr:unnamed protein product [Caenorhabditis bovis]
MDDIASIRQALEDNIALSDDLSQQLRDVANKAQKLLNEWSHYRKDMIEKMYAIANDLDTWEKNCAMSTAVGSGVGLASGFATIGGLLLFPPAAIAGMIVGAVAGASNVATNVSKMNHFKNLANELNGMTSHDKYLFERLMEARSELFDIIGKVIDAYYKDRKFDGFDIPGNIHRILGASTFGAGGFATKFAAAQMGRLTSSLVKGILHGAAVVGIILDGVSLAISAKELGKSSSKFAREVREAAEQYERQREKVCNNFLNEDVWNE